MRKIERQHLLLSDNVVATIYIEDLKISGHIIDLNPHGFGIVTDGALNFIKLKPCRLVVSTKKDKEFAVNGTLIHKTSLKNGLAKIGISIVKNHSSQYKRTEDRIPLDKDFTPTAFAKHPILFDQDMYFSIINLSSEGFCLRTSLSNKFIFENMNVDINLVLPQIGCIPCQINIKNVSVSNNSYQINASYKPSEKSHELISRYLMLTHKFSPKILRNLGFSLKTALNGRFENAGHHELNEIFNLRHKAYGQKKDLIAEMSPLDLKDRFDENAKHIIYKVNEKIVAAARIVFNQNDSKNTEIFGKYNAPIENKLMEKQFVEVSKFCIDSNYSNTDIFKRLVLQCVKTAFESNSDCIVAVVEKPLIPIYRKIGLENIGDPIFYEAHNTFLYPMCGVIKEMLARDFFVDLRKYL